MQLLKISTVVLFAGVVFAANTFSQETASGEKPKDTLHDDALAVSGRFARFERLLSQMADLFAVEDPDRAELLRRAITQSRQNAIGSNIDAIVQLLAKESLSDAIEKQEISANAMAALLKLLQSEDRRSAVEKERERLDNILKNVRNTIAQQRAARAAAQNSPAPSNAAPQQQKTIDKTDGILDGIKEHDKAKATESESADGELEAGSDSKSDAESDESGKSGEPKSKSSEGDSPDSKSDDPSEKSEGAPKDSEGDLPKDGEKNGKDDSGEPSGDNEKPTGDPKGEPNKSSDGKESSKEESGQPPKPGQNQNSQNGKEPPPGQTPGRDQLQEALELMQKAMEQLQEQEREQAVGNQDEAIAKLETAAKELEELLRQLREEEKEMVLAALEARFQRMLALETQIYETTVALAETPRSEWLDTAISECLELAQQQATLTQECSLTTSLLREDGTSVSILVAVEDIEADMADITDFLHEKKAGALTQSMETDVIDALKELIEVTQQEMQEMKSKEQDQKQSQQPQKKPPLVELMAEIKVLRSLQLRVNRRTKQVNDLQQAGNPAEAADLQDQVVELARRQDRLKESARELARKLERS